jgi:hypothetical protein
MIGDTTKHPFTEHGIEDAPAVSGVYWLWDGDELIFVGKAVGENVTIRACLQLHLQGGEGKCTQEATSFGFEMPDDPDMFIKDAIGSWEWHHKRLPRCN